LLPDIDKIIEFINRNNLTALPVGRYEIEGTASFLMIQQYETKRDEEIKWESHNKYVDLQYILYGSEKMGHIPSSRLRISSAYDKDKDLILYEEPDFFTSFDVYTGFFAVFFPTDAHKPSRMIDSAKEVKKAIIKLPVI
jgi:YhcH/YjgK/YiaL family protein